MVGEAGRGEQAHHLSELLGHSIDDIMIGAAETPFFVDLVKKKIEHDVEIAADVFARADEVAHSTEQIADNAERAAAIAAEVRSGEVMHDLSAPIYVDGRHWGGFRVGYRSSAA